MDQDALERAILADLLDELGDDEHHFWLTTGDIDTNIWRIETYGFEDEKREIIKGASFLEIVNEAPLGQSGVMFDARFTQPPRIVYGDESAEIARLRAAGRALAENIWAEGYVYCMACEQEKKSGHAADCPALVFASEAKEE
jgi:hypothetical protein